VKDAIKAKQVSQMWHMASFNTIWNKMPFPSKAQAVKTKNLKKKLITFLIKLSTISCADEQVSPIQKPQAIFLVTTSL